MKSARLEMGVPIEELKPAAYNPRKITPQHFEKLKTSLREFGFVDPVVANEHEGREGIVVGGHMRLLAAKELGYAVAPVAWIDVDEVMEKAINIALNNRELAGEWDVGKLVDVLREVSADDVLLSGTGFEDYQVERFQRQMNRMQAPPPVYPIASKLDEHYDYVVIWCDNATDFSNLRGLLGIGTERSYKKQKKGIGRVVPFKRFYERWEEAHGSQASRGRGEDGSGGGTDAHLDADGA